MRRDERTRSDLELYILKISFRVDSPSCAVQPRSGTVTGAHLGPRWPGAQNGPARHDSIGRADGGERGRVRVGEHG